MIVTLVVVMGLGLLAMGLWRGVGRWRRTRGAARLGDATITRRAHGVDLRVLLFRTRVFHGMLPGRTHLATGDLYVGPERFLMSTDKGVLADLATGRGRRFRSVRCTGPGRLVIEGDVPVPDGPPGLYRFELVIDDAPAWAEALQPFVEPGADAVAFGSFAP